MESGVARRTDFHHQARGAHIDPGDRHSVLRPSNASDFTSTGRRWASGIRPSVQLLPDADETCGMGPDESDGPRASSAEVARRMRAQPRRDTAPELAIRRELFSRGLRYRVDFRAVGRRRVDIAFTRRKVAVFVDGCFWHSCPAHRTSPRSNAEWWRRKLDANVRRDRDTDAELEAHGWLVVRVWEHENPAEAASRIEMLIRSQ